MEKYSMDVCYCPKFKYLFSIFIFLILISSMTLKQVQLFYQSNSSYTAYSNNYTLIILYSMQKIIFECL